MLDDVGYAAMNACSSVEKTVDQRVSVIIGGTRICKHPE
jgi:hypothetical protein